MSDLSSSVLVQHMNNSLTVLLPCIQANEGDCCNQRSDGGVVFYGKEKRKKKKVFGGGGMCNPPGPLPVNLILYLHNYNFRRNFG